MPPLVENPAIAHLLRSTTDPTHHHSSTKSSSKFSLGGSGNVFKMFKLLPMLSTGCKMVALLGRPNKHMLGDRATTVTLFGPRRGRICMAIQEDPRSHPYFLIELPILASSLHKEMSSDGPLKLALESDSRPHRKKLLDEYVWAVYCNGRKSGFAIRRKSASDDEKQVIKLLRGVSMGAGVLPPSKDDENKNNEGDQLTYMRARFERVVGSKDSEALYMIGPDAAGGPELSIFFVRVK